MVPCLYIGGSRGGARRARPPPYGSRFFHFDMQNFQKVAASGVHGSPYEVHAPPLREILDPPLLYQITISKFSISNSEFNFSAYCPAGYHLLDDASCKACPENFYKTNATGLIFETECTSCPDLRPRNLKEGSITPDDCLYRKYFGF